MKKIIVFVTGMMLLLSSAVVFAEETTTVQPKDSIGLGESGESGQVVVYYLHMNRRCMTCKKLEKYSDEAITTGFADQLKDSSIVWRVENFEIEGNEHFAKDYQLFSQSLILSRQVDGKEIAWKNLDKIWELVGDKDKFTTYVQTEITKFMNQAKDD